jgi:hypothetical protein
MVNPFTIGTSISTAILWTISMGMMHGLKTKECSITYSAIVVRELLQYGSMTERRLFTCIDFFWELGKIARW